MQVKRHSCVNLIEQNTQPHSTVWMALKTIETVITLCKIKIYRLHAAKPTKKFHSPASHVAISQKLAQELKEIKHYCPFHMHS